MAKLLAVLLALLAGCGGTETTPATAALATPPAIAAPALYSQILIQALTDLVGEPGAKAIAAEARETWPNSDFGQQSFLASRWHAAGGRKWGLITPAPPLSPFYMVEGMVEGREGTVVVKPHSNEATIYGVGVAPP